MNGLTDTLMVQSDHVVKEVKQHTDLDFVVEDKPADILIEDQSIHEMYYN